jgi:hypothetical protein
MIDQKLLEDEAANCGINIAALVHEEITSRMTPITPDEVATFHTENKAKLQGDDKMLAGHIEAFLNAQRVQARQMEFLRALRACASVEVFLTASNLQR